MHQDYAGFDGVRSIVDLESRFMISGIAIVFGIVVFAGLVRLCFSEWFTIFVEANVASQRAKADVYRSKDRTYRTSKWLSNDFSHILRIHRTLFVCMSGFFVSLFVALALAVILAPK